MLKKIPVRQLRLGMHLHELCGAWLDHPFWKTKFVLKDVADLKKLLASGVNECWIDASKGLDVAPPPGPAVVPLSMPKPAAPAAAPQAVAAARPVPAPSASLADETRRAAALCDQSRQAVMSLFNEARMGRSLDTEQCVDIVSDITASVWRNPGALVSLARLKTHDDYTYMHSVAVAALMVSLARQLGLDEAQGRDAGMAGLLHDMGKAMMPLDILNKPGKLSDGEFVTIKTHPQRGHELLQGGESVNASVNAVVLDVCLHHHEKMDGTGYPHQLQGDAISLFARMGAVCDVYDAITSNRPYKAGWDPAESVARMAGWANGHFDDTVFKAFVTSLGIYPTGSLVRMQSGLLAVVVEQNAASLVQPVVKVFFSTRSDTHIPPRLLDLSRPNCVDRILARESNEHWKFTHLDELWAGVEALRKLGRKV